MKFIEFIIIVLIFSFIINCIKNFLKKKKPNQKKKKNKKKKIKSEHFRKN